MIDESLINIVECWNGFSWYDRKLIWWRCYKYKHKITGKEIIGLATLVSILGVLIWENHQQHMIGLLSLTVLFYFYTILVDYIYKRAYS